MPSTRPATLNSLEVGLHLFQGTGRSLLCKYFRLFISTSNPVCMSWVKLLKTKTPVIIRVRPLQPVRPEETWQQPRWFGPSSESSVCVCLECFGFTADEAGMWRLHRRGFGCRADPCGGTHSSVWHNRHTHTHTHTARRCVRVRHHLPRFPDAQKQSVPPSWLSSETADPENNWSKILPSYFKYLQSYGLSKYLLGIISGLT